MVTPFSSALRRATCSAFPETSTAVTSALGNDLASETAMQPEPVPISIIFKGLEVGVTVVSTQSTNSSVSGRGISTFLSTKKR